MTEHILEVDLVAFESGSTAARRAVVDGVMRSLETGFVYTSHDVPESLIDDAYGMLEQFFSLSIADKTRFTVPGAHGQTGYTGVLVETAEISDKADWKEMLNWGPTVPPGHPLRVKYPLRFMDQVLPEAAVPGITKVLERFRESFENLQIRFLRIIAEGLGAHESFFDSMMRWHATLTRAIHYPPMVDAPEGGHVWSAEHGDINLITALPRATAKGLQVRLADGTWVDAVAPAGLTIINTGIMLEHVSNGVLPTGWHRVIADPGAAGDRYSVVQFAGPAPWTILTPLQSCVTPDRPQRFGAIEAGDRLSEVLYGINMVDEARRISD
jgi:isopenicillin N synthase-like dioxygenase